MPEITRVLQDVESIAEASKLLQWPFGQDGELAGFSGQQFPMQPPAELPSTCRIRRQQYDFRTPKPARNQWPGLVEVDRLGTTLRGAAWKVFDLNSASGFASTRFWRSRLR